MYFCLSDGSLPVLFLSFIRRLVYVIPVSLVESTGFKESDCFFAFCMAIQESGFHILSVQALHQGQYMLTGYSWIDSQSQMLMLEGWATPLSNDVILVNTFSP